jgi:hypothetical protein
METITSGTITIQNTCGTGACSTSSCDPSGYSNTAAASST